jgi:hypothetical protein
MTDQLFLFTVHLGWREMGETLEGRLDESGEV